MTFLAIASSTMATFYRQSTDLLADFIPIMRITMMLLQEGKEAFRKRCLLPVIDLCNHSSSGATCSLSIFMGSDGQPRYAEVCYAMYSIESSTCFTSDEGLARGKNDQKAIF